MDNINWDAISAIGSFLGAIITAAAVIVALWQTRYTNRKKLKLEFSDNIIILDTNGKVISEYIGVTVTNVGNRDVIITEWAILVEDSDGRHIIMTEEQGIMKIKLPVKLAVEEALNLSYKKQYFNNLVKDLIEKGMISSKKKIKFQVRDTTGKKYIVYSKKKAENYL